MSAYTGELTAEDHMKERAPVGEPDRLGRHHLPGAIAAGISSFAQRPGESSISAVIGPWGSGKTWILENVAAELQHEDSELKMTVLQFNPWLYADEDSLFVGFAGLLLGAIKEGGARKKAARVLEYIGPAAKFGPVDASGLIARVATDVRGLSSPASIAGTLSQELEGRKERLCIVIDDLDRLNPDELVTLLKLVRLLGNIPNVHYLLSYDEETLLFVLGNTALAKDDPERARSYLEKMVERRFVLPPLTSRQRRELALLPLLEFVETNGISLHQRSRESLEWVFDQVLQKRLSTMRSIERLLDEVTAIPALLQGEVDFKDWVLAAFIKLQSPAAWRFILDHREQFVGGGGIANFDDRDGEKFGLTVHGRLLTLGIETEFVTMLMDLMSVMFPGVKLPPTSFVAGRSTVQESEHRMGIGHPDYFDRYAWSELPPDDVSDHEVRLAMRALTVNNPAGPELEKLYRDDASALISRITRNLDDPEVAKTPLVLFLSGLLGIQVDSTDPFLSSHSLVILAALEVVSKLSEDEAVEVFKRAQTDPSLTVILEEILHRRVRYSQAGSYLDDQLEKFKVRRVADLVAELQAAPTPSVEDLPARERALALRRLDPAAFAELAKNQQAAGRWRADDVVSLFIDRYSTRELLLCKGVNEDALRRAMGDPFILSIYPLESVEVEPFNCLDRADNPSYHPADLQTMRQLAQGAVAQLSRAIKEETEGV